MKVIGHLINTFLRNSENFIYDQIKNIKEFKIEVLTRKWINRDRFAYQFINTFESKNNINYYIEFLSYTIFRKSNFFEEVIKKKNISLIHAHYGVEGVYALPVKKKFSLPLIVSFYGQDITRLPKFILYPPAWLNYWLYFDVLQREGDFFLAICDFLGQRLRERGFPEEKVRTHYVGVAIGENFLPVRREKIILTAGRLVEKKGTEYLIKAMSEIIKRNQEVKLLISGDGELRGHLESLAQILGVTRHVSFLGWQSREELFRLMKRSLIFVLPSVTAKDGDCEGLPTVILEAMARGMPVIGTYHAGIPEAVIEGETGFLVSERDYKELAERIEVLLADPYLAQKMGERGKELVEEKFNLFKQIKRLEEIYREFL